MILVNNGSNPLAHGTYILPKGERRDIPNDIAKEWLTIPGVERFISTVDVKKATKDADEKIQALQAENDKLKAEIVKLKEAQKATKDVDEPKETAKK